MNEQEWVRYAASGTPTVVSIARLEPDLCRSIRARTNLVRIRHDYVLKFIQKHGIEPHHLPMVQNAIEFGRAIADRPNHITFLYFDAHVFGGWFQTTIKATDSGQELWVVTFHKQNLADVIRLSKRHRILRPEKW